MKTFVIKFRNKEIKLRLINCNARNISRFFKVSVGNFHIMFPTIQFFIYTLSIFPVEITLRSLMLQILAIFYLYFHWHIKQLLLCFAQYTSIFCFISQCSIFSGHTVECIIKRNCGLGNQHCSLIVCKCLPLLIFAYTLFYFSMFSFFI